MCIPALNKVIDERLDGTGQIIKLHFPDGQSQHIVSDKSDPGLIYAEFLCWRWDHGFLGRHRHLHSELSRGEMLDESRERQGDEEWPEGLYRGHPDLSTRDLSLVEREALGMPSGYLPNESGL